MKLFVLFCFVAGTWGARTFRNLLENPDLYQGDILGIKSKGQDHPPVAQQEHDEDSEDVYSKKGQNELQGNCNKCGIVYGNSGFERVINGTPVKPVYKYPWIVALLDDKMIKCGGFLISATFVMTAGHCVFNKKMLSLPQCRGKIVDRSCYINPYTIGVGLLGPQQRSPFQTMTVSRIIGHPMYSYTMQMNDVALIQMTKAVRCSVYNMPVCLPHRDFHKIGKQLTITGYGHNTPDGWVGPQLLREGLVREIDPRRCAKQKQPANVTNSLICAAGMESGQSSCYGDSGSAVVGKYGRKFYAVGIVSYGIYLRCTALNPVAYSKVYFFLSFIKQHVRDLPNS